MDVESNYGARGESVMLGATIISTGALHAIILTASSPHPPPCRLEALLALVALQPGARPAHPATRAHAPTGERPHQRRGLPRDLRWHQRRLRALLSRARAARLRLPLARDG